MTGLFLRGRKLDTSLIFILQSYFKVPKTKTKRRTLFYHENALQKKTSKNIIKSFD